MAEITSRPFRPSMACQACVFGSGDHAHWCELHGCNCKLPLGLHMSGEPHAKTCPVPRHVPEPKLSAA